MRHFLLIYTVSLLTLCLSVFSEEQEIPEYEDKIVRNIFVQVKDIFEGEDLNFIYDSANKFKFKTIDVVIRRELTFNPGNKINKFLVTESLRNLRSLRYLRKIEVKPIVINKEEVDVYVTARDTWTLIPQLSFSSGDGRNKRSIGIAESNLMGNGNRLEFLFVDDDGKETFQTVYDDRRFLGTPNDLTIGFFDRNDGEIGNLIFERPFRTLLDENAYGVSFNYGDTAESLYRAASERFVFRQDVTDVNLYYTFATGDPEVNTKRFSFGYNYFEKSFEEATLEDFEDLDLNPEELDLDDMPVPANRRFSGPIFAFQSITPEFVSKNYIDRFDWVEYYNLGNQFSTRVQYAPEFLGSDINAFLVSGNFATGTAFSDRAFLRGEIGATSRYQEGGFENTILKGQLRYYNVLGQKYLMSTYLGRHTLAAGLSFEYAEQLDKDNEFLLGADNFLRGYDARTFSGDKRIALNLEDRIHLYDDLFQLLSIGTVFFIDVGAASFDNLDQMLQDEIYSDIGLGLRIGFPRSSGSRVVRLDLAFPLRDGPDGTEEFEPRFLASVSQVFDSFLSTELVNRQRASIDTGF